MEFLEDFLLGIALIAGLGFAWRYWSLRSRRKTK